MMTREDYDKKAAFLLRQFANVHDSSRPTPPSRRAAAHIAFDDRGG